MSADDLVLGAYGATNVLRLLGYVPQIVRVMRDRDGARAISCLGWTLWTSANATTALYAWTHLRDLPLTLINAGNAIGCATVVVLVLHSRLRLARRAMPTRGGLDEIVDA